MNFCVAFGTRSNHLAPVKSTQGITASGAMSELCFDHHQEFFYRTSPSANLIEQRLLHWWIKHKVKNTGSKATGGYTCYC